jgi:hypothetical protein
VEAIGAAAPNLPQPGITVCDTNISTYEIRKKTIAVPPDDLLERPRFDAVEHRQIIIEHHFLAPNKVDASLNLNRERVFFHRRRRPKE